MLKERQSLSEQSSCVTITGEILDKNWSEKLFAGWKGEGEKKKF